MRVRWVVLFAGVVAVVVGVVALLMPVNVGEAQVDCGSAIVPDLSEARAATDLGGVNIPVLDEVIANPDYEELCQMELEDRRLWAITLAAVGALVVIGALVLFVRGRRDRVPGRQT